MDINKILDSGKLYPHQVESIKKSREYILGYKNSVDEFGGALNRLPTGTGKTGIITVLARCFDDIPNVLILTTSRALRDQMLADISYDFFQTIKLDNNLFEKNVEIFYPSTIQKILSKNKGKNTVYISTIQTLNEICSDALNHLFKELQNTIDLLIFDEGHREPAPEWANAVRSLNKPTILFTATPYRNDRLKFNINDKYIYAFTHQEANEQNFIRSVKFHELSSSARDYDDFVQELLDQYNDKILKNKPSGIDVARVIIRCDNSQDIEAIVNRINDKGVFAKGFHDNFKGEYLEKMPNKLYFAEQVIDLKKERSKALKKGQKELDKYEKDLPVFWVHQFKLLEGIDEHSFCAVAIYSPMRNARMLIQQVGRVLRNRNQSTGNFAYVLTQKGSPDTKFWHGYRKYETQYEDSSVMEMLYYQEIFDSLTYTMPDFHYEGKDFKSRFDWYKLHDLEGKNIDKDFKYSDHIKYKLSCNIYENNSDITIKEVENNIISEWKAKEYDVRLDRAEYQSQNIFVLPYVSVNDTSIFHDMYHFSFKLGYVFIYKTKKYLFFYDSNNSFSEYISKNFKQVNPDKLNKLLEGGTSNIQNITLRSTDIGDYILRRQNITASSLNKTVVDLVDYMNFYSTALGKTESEGLHSAQRYVGFTRSKVTDQTSICFDIENYKIWLDHINEVLSEGSRNGSSFFERYAQFTSPPSKTSPINILIDFDELDGFFKYGKEGPEVIFDLTCYEVKNEKLTLKFKLSNGLSLEYKNVTVKYDDDKKRYYLKCPEIVKDLFHYTDDGKYNKNENIIKYLNRLQSFRIIPKEKDFIYAHSQFYEPKFDILEQIGAVFEPIVTLKDYKSEKGKKCGIKTWEKNSLFRLVDELGSNTKLNSHLKDLDFLICDDTGSNETSDFIGIQNNPPKIILIHCKAFKKGKIRSATAFQEVFGQAIKNLSYLVPNNTMNPPNYESWDQDWSAGNVKGMLKRCRVYNGKKVSAKTKINIENLLDLFHKIIRDPSAKKEVFILMGNGFNYNKFIENLNSNSKNPVNIQLKYLVQSTWSNVRKVATDFKIFCN